MSKKIEIVALMKDNDCGYEDSVSTWIFVELNQFYNDKMYQMACPECDHTM